MTPQRLESIAKDLQADLAKEGYVVTIEETRILMRLCALRRACLVTGNPKLKQATKQFIKSFSR